MVNSAAIHASDCEWHLDQYPWECSCGALPRMSYTEWVTKQREKWAAEKRAAEWEHNGK
jgi:hypothetical protein